MAGDLLMELVGVAKSFRAADGTVRGVLEGVEAALHENEIVALLGRSGSGKSTLLRIMAGLVRADRGSVTYRRRPVEGPVPDVAMVFQSFALFPWLTVQQNVELGLEARGVPRAERGRRANAVLQLMGLSGFGGALPRELSGGMKQRVGIARALVVEPVILLMDEAFSALDVLTGETLRNDILALWETGRLPIKSILVVSHNIEEAVIMADRLVILGGEPGRLRSEIAVTPPRPRTVDDPEVRALIDEVYGLMTMRHPAEGAGARPPARLGYRLPKADIFHLEGVLHRLSESPFNGHADLPHLTEELALPGDDLYPAYEALALLGLALMEKGDITLTPLGHRYVRAEQSQRQEIFGQQLLTHVPLAAHIRRTLEQEPTGAVPARDVTELLEKFLEAPEARQVFGVAVEWGRYGEVYEYDYHTGRLALPEEDEDAETGEKRGE